VVNICPYPCSPPRTSQKVRQEEEAAASRSRRNRRRRDMVRRIQSHTFHGVVGTGANGFSVYSACASWFSTGTFSTARFALKYRASEYFLQKIIYISMLYFYYGGGWMWVVSCFPCSYLSLKYKGYRCSKQRSYLQSPILIFCYRSVELL
jgi:hypothetical protein